MFSLTPSSSTCNTHWQTRKDRKGVLILSFAVMQILMNVDKLHFHVMLRMVFAPMSRGITRVPAIMAMY